MPIETRSIPIETPESADLADLRCIDEDLTKVGQLCMSAITMARDPNHDIWLVDGIIAAAVVRYARCFKIGGATRFRLDVSDVLPELLAEHEFFAKLRSAHVAHDVAPFEHAVILAEIAYDGETPVEVVGVSRMQWNARLLSQKDAERLSALAAAVSVEVVRPMRIRKSAALLQALRAMPIEEVLKAKKPPDSLFGTTPFKTRTQRPKGRAG